MEPIVLLSSCLHLSVQLKRPINNGAPLPWPVTPLLCFWSEGEWGRERGSIVASINPTTCCCPGATTGGRDVCRSFRIFGGWFMELFYIYLSTLIQSKRVTGVCPHTPSIHLMQTDIPTYECHLTAACVHQRYAPHLHILSAHIQTALIKVCSQEVFEVYSNAQWCYKLLNHRSSQCLHSVTEIYLVEAQWSSNTTEIWLCLH